VQFTLVNMSGNNSDTYRIFSQIRSEPKVAWEPPNVNNVITIF
jgi:hypothetical protein